MRELPRAQGPVSETWDAADPIGVKTIGKKSKLVIGRADPSLQIPQ